MIQFTESRSVTCEGSSETGLWHLFLWPALAHPMGPMIALVLVFYLGSGDTQCVERQPAYKSPCRDGLRGRRSVAGAEFLQTPPKNHGGTVMHVALVTHWVLRRNHWLWTKASMHAM